VSSNWFQRHLTEEILPRWLEASVTPCGAFLPRLDRKWQPKPEQVLTLVSQSRLIYNFVRGHELTGDAAYIGAAQSGARFLLDAFRDRQHGGWFWSVAPDGAVLDAGKDTYGHAFALFGLSHALRATGAAELREAAHHTWEVLNTRLRDAHGGFVRRTESDFSRPAPGRSANPVMHLFEALQAMVDVEPAFLAEAQRVAEFACSLVRQADGLLPELYADDWRPLTTEEGGTIDLGHQFEWAYLLSAGVERGLPADQIATAARLLDGGIRLGIDPADGGVLSNANMEAQTRPGGKGAWQQCEAARALMHFWVVRGKGGVAGRTRRLLEFIRSRLIDSEYGGWYVGLREDGSPASTDKGNEWKLDYHVVGMCSEAIRLGVAL